MRYDGVPNALKAMQPKILGSRWGGLYTLKIAFGWLGSESFISAPKLEEYSSVKEQCNYMCSLMRYHGVPNDLNVMQPLILGSRWCGQYTLKSVFGWLGSEFFISAPPKSRKPSFRSTVQLYVKFDEVSRSAY